MKRLARSEIKLVINNSLILLAFVMLDAVGCTRASSKVRNVWSAKLSIIVKDGRHLAEKSTLMTIPYDDPSRFTLIAAIWDDGLVVWSDDRKLGGPPYWFAFVDPSTADSIHGFADALLSSVGSLSGYEGPYFVEIINTNMTSLPTDARSIRLSHMFDDDGSQNVESIRPLVHARNGIVESFLLLRPRPIGEFAASELDFSGEPRYTK